ncbi:MAG: UvrD-helicase domain-containing protein [Candidatus Krumholzibacteria bacterium]|nr:UvrD-helicase domain-containing protein [Candidatus Krumholzibacteria bacterium]
MKGERATRPVDFEARLRAVSDLDSSLCLEAGAGTGKTTLLVDRYLSIIGQGRALPGQIVAITFTEKAAAEMKSRLRREIDSRIASLGRDDVSSERFREARSHLESAHISTIHAFASSLLRENPVEAGIDPGFGLLDDIEGEMLLDECWNTFLSRPHEGAEDIIRSWYMAGGRVDNLRDLAMHFYYGRGNEALSGIFEDAAGNISEHVPVDTSVSEQTKVDTVVLPESLADLVEESISRLKLLLESSCDDRDDKGAVLIGKFSGEAALMEGLEGEFREEFALCLAIPKPKGNKSNWDPKTACDEQKKIFRDMAAAQSAARTARMEKLAPALNEWLAGFVSLVEERKREQSLMDFDDLLIKARLLLRDGGLLEELRRRYRFFLVDEFQDTDPLQAEIIMLLSCSPGSREIAPGPGRLFIVGDPKQSIYRFRNADVEIYEKVKRKFIEAKAYLKITQNFRSLPGITEWVNRAFSLIINKPADGCYQPDYEPVYAFREGDATAVISLELDPVTEKAEDVRKAESDSMSRFIYGLIDSERTVMDPVTRKSRRIRFGDIAVLYRGTTGIEHYEDGLRRAQIPYMVEGGKLYFTRQEVRDLASALWAIEDPGDSLALVSTLRSGMFGFSDEELLLFKADGGCFDYSRPGITDGSSHGDMLAAFRLLSSLHAGRNMVGPAGTLADLMRETKYVESSLLQPHGRQRVMNIRKAAQRAREFERGCHSFRFFARWMRDQEKLGVAEGESSLIDDGNDAVRLLTIHKSKGLQFPVVIMVNLMQTPRPPGRLLRTKSGGAAFSLGNGWQTLDYDRAVEDEKVRDRAESARMLYVAATRAGELLVIPRTFKKNSLYEMISDAVTMNVVEREDTGAVIPAGGDPGDVLSLDASLLESADGRTRPEIEKDPAGGLRKIASSWKVWREEKDRKIFSASSCPVRISPSGLKAGVPGRKPEERFAEGPHGDAAGGGVPGGESRALFIGNVFHRIMEIADLSSVDGTCSSIGGLLEGSGYEDAYPEIEKMVKNTLALDPMIRAAGASRVFREMPFSFPVYARNAVEQSAEEQPIGFAGGRVDLLFQDEGGWTLIDFKTDDVAPDAVESRMSSYMNQGGVYALALAKAGLKMDGGVYFIFARPGVAVRLDVTASLLEEAGSLVETIAMSHLVDPLCSE